MTLVTFRPLGMNNVDLPENVGRRDTNTKALVYTEAVDLLNIDPNEKGGGSLRGGAVLDLIGIDPHSGWSDGKQAYFVEASMLKRFWPGVGSDILAVLESDDPADFCPVNDIVVMSNGKDFKVIEDGEVSTPFVPSSPFKEPMSPGHLLEFYNGRLYAALDNVVYASDSLDSQDAGGIEQMDERKNVVAVFASEVQMIKRVAGGLYVSDMQETFFLAGSDPFIDEGFRQDSIFPYPALKGSVKTVTPGQLGLDIKGECCVWASDRGVCIGLPGGSAFNASEDVYQPPTGKRGAGLVRSQNGQVHYLCVVRDPQQEHNAHEERSEITVTTKSII